MLVSHTSFVFNVKKRLGIVKCHVCLSMLFKDMICNYDFSYNRTVVIQNLSILLLGIIIKNHKHFNYFIINIQTEIITIRPGLRLGPVL
jgi:hypothetical protein